MLTKSAVATVSNAIQISCCTVEDVCTHTDFDCQCARVSQRITAARNDDVVAAQLALEPDAARDVPDSRMVEEQRFGDHLPGARRPMALGLKTDEIRRTISLAPAEPL